MMGSLKLQLWNIRFPLRSRSWSLMHENAHFKNALVITELTQVFFFFCFCNAELLYLSDIVGLLHIKHDELY